MTSPAIRPSRGWRDRLRVVALFVGALLFLFEEWLWVHVSNALRRLGRLALFRWNEARLATLPPPVALTVLCGPVLLLFPFKIFGLWLMGTGRFWSGCLVMLAAKVCSTAIVARIFIACRPQLLQMDWFARLHAWTLVARDRIHRWLDEEPTWQAVRRSLHDLRDALRAGLRRLAGRRDAGGRRGLLLRWRTRRRAQRRRDTAARSR